LIVFERILYAKHVEGNGPEIYTRACAVGLGAIGSKQTDSPYRFRAAGKL
jgi:hypothetical protein